MCQNSTKNKEVVSSRTRELIDRDLGYWIDNDFNIPVHSRRGADREMGTRTYAISFQKLIREFVQDEGYFYFYPGLVRGFVDSCIVASQRDLSYAERQASIFRDLMAAMDSWQQKEEEAAWRQAVTFRKNESLTDLEIRNALEIGIDIDDEVLGIMDIIRDALGDYAIDPTDIRWRRNDVVHLTVNY